LDYRLFLENIPLGGRKKTQLSPSYLITISQSPVRRGTKLKFSHEAKQKKSFIEGKCAGPRATNSSQKPFFKCNTKY
jgi:hypothetical protein